MAEDLFGLAGKASLVIGGGSGIGRATALLLGRAGADVAVADLDADRATAVAEEVAGTGATTISLSGDVTDRVGAETVVAEAYQGLEGLDVVINIVGMAGWADIMSTDDELWELDLRRNLHHHLYVGRAAARHMIDQGRGGAIAIVASVSGIYGAPMHAAYGAAKAGAMALARSMANEWGRYGIRVNAVAPDVIATPRVVAGFAESGIEDVSTVAKREGVPLGRFGVPEEIAGPLVFLCSPHAGFMSGQTLVVDGGTQAKFPHGTGAFSGDDEGGA